MSEWKKVKIGDFLTEREGRYKPDDSKISKYKRLDKIDFSGTIHISDKPTKTDMIIVHPGDLVISGINVAKGAVAVYQGDEPVCATIHYSSYTFDSSKVDLDYFKYFVKSPEFIAALQKQVKGGIKTEIKPKHLLPLEISIPDLQTQQEIVKKISLQLKKTEQLSVEIESQKNYIKQLRQNILQEAIEGNLTADWRKQNPVQKGNPDYDAEALFEQIQKGEASPSLQPASQFSATPSAGDTPATPPIEIPQTWKWVKLGNLGILSGGKRLPAGEAFSVKETNHIYIRIKDMKNDSVDLSDLKYISDKLAEKLKRYCIYKDELYITIAGTIGQVGIIPECLDGMNLTENSSKLKPFIIKNVFLKYFIKSEFIQSQFKNAVYGMALPKLALKRIASVSIPLPPLKEQEEIVNKVETLLAKVTTLENQIQDRKSLSDKLIFGIIKEKLEE